MNDWLAACMWQLCVGVGNMRGSCACACLQICLNVCEWLCDVFMFADFIKLHFNQQSLAALSPQPQQQQQHCRQWKALIFWRWGTVCLVYYYTAFISPFCCNFDALYLHCSIGEALYANKSRQQTAVACHKHTYTPMHICHFAWTLNLNMEIVCITVVCALLRFYCNNMHCHNEFMYTY